MILVGIGFKGLLIELNEYILCYILIATANAHSMVTAD